MSEPSMMRIAVQLRADRRAPGVARQFLTTACEAAGLASDICATAALLVSELVTNAVLHAGTEVRMEVVPAVRCLRVEVSDADPVNLPQLRPLEPTAICGRGLHLVDAQATRWGWATAVEGKTVWFELELPPPPGKWRTAPAA